jgi:hypothetical protein
MKLIGKSMYGKKYAFDGGIPLSIPNVSSLEWGDVIIDNNGKGMRMYVNECSKCGKKYLAGLLIFQAEKCNDCYRSGLFNGY